MKKKRKKTIRFSVRLPEEQHRWLKELSNSTKGTNDFTSMNEYISLAIDTYREKYSRW